VRRVKTNIAANFAGQTWSILMGLAFIPIYIRLLGVEQYALVGFYAILQGLFTVLDMGLSTTLNREIARLSGSAEGLGSAHHLVRTMEVIYWIVAVVIGGGVVAVSGPVSEIWLSATDLPPEVVQRSVAMMGVLLAVQWPISLYSGGVMGLQRQIPLRVVNSVVATMRGVGGTIVLLFVSSTITAYFAWQIFVGLVQVLSLALLLWRSLPWSTSKPRFETRLISGFWRFSAGVSGVQIVTILLTQLPGLLLSKLLDLEAFGYYTIAQGVASWLFYLASPIFEAVFPGLSSLSVSGNQTDLKTLYHWGCQLMSLVVLPLAAIIAVFSPQIMLLWTGNATAAAETQHLVSLLVVGSALNAAMYLPYGLQLANGWTRLTFLVNTAALAVLGPMVFRLTSEYGAVGAAYFWLLLNLAYLLVIPNIMHRRVLRGEKRIWYLYDFVLPALAAASIPLIGRIPANSLPSATGQLIAISGVAVITYAVTLLTVSRVRADALGWLVRLRTAKVG